MEENSQTKIQRLKQRVKDYLFVVEQSISYKRNFIASSLFDKATEDEMQVILECVEELSEVDLNSICSDPELIKGFREYVKTNEGFEVMASEL